MNAATRSSTTVDFVDEFVAAAGRFASSVPWSDMRAPVPSCPGWTTYDLVVHLGNVHAWAATIVETGDAAAEQNDEPRSARSRVVAEWYAGKAGDLYEVLRHADPDAPCWTFATGAGVAGFWPRRQLHETLIHLLDLEQAADRAPTPTSAAVAADGVDEVLTVFVPRMHRRGHPARLERPLGLTAVDTGEAWTVEPPSSSEAPLVPAQPAGASRSGSVPPPVVRRLPDGLPHTAEVLAAPAEALHRLLWKRVGPADADVRIEGDVARVEAFLGSRLVP